MFLRSAIVALFSLTALPAAAACVGQSYLDLISDSQRATLEANVETVPYAEGLTWEAVRGNDTLTIIGTMHIYDPRLDPLRDKVGDAVTNADLVMLEATPNEEAALQDLIVTDPGRLFIVDGPTLPELLDEETWGRLADAASDRSRSRG